MKIGFVRFFVIIYVFSSTIMLQAKMNKPSPQEIQSYLFAEQNRPSFGMENPLKGFSTFIFFPMYPAGNKNLSDKIGLLIKKELEKIGSVNKIELETKDENGVEGIDLSPFALASALIYQIRNLPSLDGKETGFVRASLSFESRVNIVKTKQNCSPYLWVSNCFLKGNTEKDLDKLVLQSLAYLMRDFSESYSSANSDKPIFNLYSP
jgi:hypothetical protein